MAVTHNGTGWACSFVLLTLAFTGCAEPQVRASWPDEALFAYRLEPETLDLGDLDVGESAVVDLAVINTGDAPILLDEALLALAGEAQYLHVPTRYIEPGSNAVVAVRWTPERSGMLSTSVALSLGPTPSEITEVAVPVTGAAHGPLLGVNIVDYDFGEVPLGCSRPVTVTLTNAGDRDVHIDGLRLQGDSDFHLETDDDVTWVIPPFQSRQVQVHYEPTHVDPGGSALIVASDAGSARSEFRGVGVAGEQLSVQLEPDQLGSTVTALVHVNTDAIPGTWSSWSPYAARFEAALPDFFDALQDSDADYRIAFVWNVNGVVDGDYIDRSYSTNSAVRETISMLAAGRATDNDQSLQTLENAVSQNERWLQDGRRWQGSNLHLVGINRDDEWPARTAEDYVGVAQRFKAPDGEVMYHAIGGPPGGCVPHAQDFVRFVKAVTLTGGTFSSVCETDWSDSMVQLANAMIGGQVNYEGAPAVPLKGAPDVSSIRVEVDGKRFGGSWRYEPRPNAVVFDGRYRLNGETLTVHYNSSSACGT